jgi:hypothetical protein
MNSECCSHGQAVEPMHRLVPLRGQSWHDLARSACSNEVAAEIASLLHSGEVEAWQDRHGNVRLYPGPSDARPRRR